MSYIFIFVNRDEVRIFEAKSIWHICNKSIANFKIFNSPQTCSRFAQIVDYYNSDGISKKFSKVVHSRSFFLPGLLTVGSFRKFKLLSYCIMPDHYHLLLKVIKEGEISHYINTIQNSFTRYLNEKYRRKGPLWQSRFRCVQIKNNSQLLHVGRYIHLNPVTGMLVDKPEDWHYSSYKDYIFDPKILDIMHEISIRSVRQYKTFVEDQIDYQKKLRSIKKWLLDGPSTTA
ncbi:hypothetical protein COY90_01730 [Candidatus Roizmanbacteria bacterium CG_4_10_14_0_8_um_filter_39_9]|uniref:Transposase IS200-like domain-containing protein n=1 Tax=Candidatus Roizmanbacteria bacterium CG_4_10_14_0_8_um_filter_39_9 TaxID=1974829 RepID=A0A2M7QEP9_9BACT|nr:MAG: hypothetical protein COY90_01730 [Candidatus Roizmanbacteria bacterium CG_4_10_14_0_8_um_filter_39_9]